MNKYNNFVLNKYQATLLEKARIDGKEKYISFPTGCGKTIASILLARKLFNDEDKLVITPSQPLTFSWGYEMEKRDITKNDYNMTCNNMSNVYSDIENLQRMIESSGKEITIRTVDYLSDMGRVREIIKNKKIIIFDEYDSYSDRMLELVTFIKKYYKTINALDRLIFVSATGENETRKNLNQRFELIENEDGSYIKDHQQNIQIMEMSDFDSIQPKNYIFETYFHLEGNEYGYHSCVHHVEELINLRDQNINDFKTLRGYDDSQTWCEALWFLLSQDTVENMIVQNHLGVGVDWNTDNLEINWDQFTRYRSDVEAQTQFIQRLGRVNRNDRSKEAIVYIVQGNIKDIYDIITKEHETLEIYSEKVYYKQILNAYINRDIFRLRPFIINIEVETPTSKGIVKSAYYTYDRLLFDGWDKETIYIKFEGTKVADLKNYIEVCVLEECSNKKEKIQNIISKRKEKIEQEIKEKKIKETLKKAKKEHKKLLKKHAVKNKEILTIQEAWIDTGLAAWNEEKNGVKFNKDVVYVPSVSDGYLLKTCKNMFGFCCELIEVELFDTLNVTDMGNMFSGCKSLVNVSLFNTSNVTNMKNMFSRCKSLVNVPLFNTDNVTDMSNMFYFCESLVIVPLFNTRNVTNMNAMFYFCKSLVIVNLFDTANVVDMRNMFVSCESLINVPSFNTTNVTYMSEMFLYCRKLRKKPLLNMINVKDAASMYDGCDLL